MIGQLQLCLFVFLVKNPISVKEDIAFETKCRCLKDGPSFLIEVGKTRNFVLIPFQQGLFTFILQVAIFQNIPKLLCHVLHATDIIIVLLNLRL